jgi:hypothetical protein
MGLLIYPIVFCYRQFIELSIKGQISDYCTKLQKETSVSHNTHDLKKLLKAYIDMCGDNTPWSYEDIRTVISCIKQFNKIDPKSFTFRYPADKNGKLYPISPNSIDIDGLRDTMAGIGTFLVETDYYLEAMTSPD